MIVVMKKNNIFFFFFFFSKLLNSRLYRLWTRSACEGETEPVQNDQ